MKTFIPKKADITRDWYIVDATGKAVGRIAVEIAKVLRGKNKPQFIPHLDTGDGVVVVNAEKVALSGNKWADKKYYRRAQGWVGNVKETTAEKVHSEKPTFVLEKAVAGMIPRTKMKTDILKRLKVYPGADHPHAGQNPKVLNIS